ncbi:four-carbon acid sugar kinase family protein [Paenibacillus yanchengensis]|uniref:Four-carbon acid sugar kinase family protein n=1 Tax=Paenibacillus yanchengensis TaxID=2035833 RepID=A0ABW4YQL7_9BACL
MTETDDIANRPWLSYYGDDFTGSTDVLETFFQAGVNAHLFLQVPTRHQMQQQNADLLAFGVAGIGRSLTPAAMEEQLSPILKQLYQLQAKIVHYKVCSTFDSARDIGSIGKVAELGRSQFSNRFIPLLAAAPHLGRYTVFGNHFAAAGPAHYRLDRHPTMSQHPVTPMNEADLRLHLSLQTNLRIAVMDVVALSGSHDVVKERLEQIVLREQPDIVIFDALDDQHLLTVGRLIWEEAEQNQDPLFVIGSSGIEKALLAYWQETGMLAVAAKEASQVTQTTVQEDNKPLLVLSGSCSPVTAGQLQYAKQHGFASIKLSIADCLAPSSSDKTIEQIYADAARLLADGKHVILYTAEGPDDPFVVETRERLMALNISIDESSKLMGPVLGGLAVRLIDQFELPRLVIAGGDTSGYIVQHMEIEALQCKANFQTGSPICAVHAEQATINGIELILKGGQVGQPNYFVTAAQTNK